jgi:hypothetical protein
LEGLYHQVERLLSAGERRAGNWSFGDLADADEHGCSGRNAHP